MSTSLLETIVGESIGNSLVTRPRNHDFLGRNIKRRDRWVKRPAYGAVIGLTYLAAALNSGCNFGPYPRIRRASLPSATIGTNFLDPNNLGSHGYRFKWSEQNGMVYTCRGGQIDVTHLRNAADWTYYLSTKIYEELMKNGSGFSFKSLEPSLYFMEFTYPENWSYLSQSEKEQIAREVSITVGQYSAYVTTTWHEILTWFDYKSLWVIPEFPSAFSWEDSFSNLLGTYTAVQALQDSEHTFDEAMTLALDSELKKLGVQSSRTARRAVESVNGSWYSVEFLLFANIKKRNFDIGLEGFITPWTIPIPECEGVEALSYLVPHLDSLSWYGFSVKLEIEPREWEKDKILRVVYPDKKGRKKRIEPAIHFAPIMEHIRKDAVERYGPDVDTP